VLADNLGGMPPNVALVWKFRRATLAHDAAADEYREAIVKRWRRRALLSLACAITAARICPTVEYALGHGKACTRVVVGGTPVMFDHGRVPALVAAHGVSSASAMWNPTATFEPYRRRLLGLASWRDRAAGAFGRDRCETSAAHVRIRGGGAERARRHRSSGAVPR
jgi:hypothetical protein